jgi:hypothetical protein
MNPTEQPKKEITNCFFSHDWPKWEDHGTSDVTNNKGGVLRKVHIQKRICKRCGKIKYRQETVIDIHKQDSDD